MRKLNLLIVSLSYFIVIASSVYSQNKIEDPLIKYQNIINRKLYNHKIFGRHNTLKASFENSTNKKILFMNQVVDSAIITWSDGYVEKHLYKL